MREGRRPSVIRGRPPDPIHSDDPPSIHGGSSTIWRCTMIRRSLRAGLVAVATGAVLLSMPPPAFGADPARDSFVFQANADITVPAGTQRDAVIAIRGDA